MTRNGIQLSFITHTMKVEGMVGLIVTVSCIDCLYLCIYVPIYLDLYLMSRPLVAYPYIYRYSVCAPHFLAAHSAHALFLSDFSG